MEYNYKEELAIDLDALEQEWLMQPKLFMKYSEAASIARRELDEAKETADYTKAELDLTIRKNPERFHLSKITENSIEATIITTPEYIESHKEYIEAQYKYSLLMGAVKAFDQRKDALENLVRLHGQSYFSTPELPHTTSPEKKDQIKKTLRKKTKSIMRSSKQNP